MSYRPVSWRPPHAPSREQLEREYDGRRGSSAERGYGARWRKARARYLKAHPWCVMCKGETPSRYVAAEVVDHIRPHRGDQRLFWDERNWQSLCKWHHDSWKQSQERSGG